MSTMDMIVMISQVGGDDKDWDVALVDNHPQRYGIQDIGGVPTVVIADN